MTANPEITFFDPNSAENPEIKELMLMRPDTGEIITPKRARWERKVAEATARRTTTVEYWGPQHHNVKHDIPEPSDLSYSA